MPVVPLTLQTQFTMTCAGVASATNVVHWLDIGGDFDQGNMDELVDLWVDNIAPEINANWLLSRSVRCLNLATDPPEEIISEGIAGNGGFAGSALPPAMAGVVSINAGASRRRRGRIYFPGMTESAWTDTGQSTGSYVEALRDAVASAATAIAVNCGYTLAVYSRADGVARAVSSISADQNIDVQRRRQARLDT